MCRIVGGLKGRLAVWQLARPGRDHDTLPVELQGRSTGIVSAIDCAPQGDLLTVGTFTALIATIDLRSFEQVSSIIGHANGIVQLQFSRSAQNVSRMDQNPIWVLVVLSCACTLSICVLSLELLRGAAGVATLSIPEPARMPTLHAGT